jgi:hypothetical protein
MCTDEVANVIVAHEDGEVGKQSWRFPELGNVTKSEKEKECT